MKLGLIARAEDRGLGNQTWEIARALRPDRVLVVDMGELVHGFPAFIDRYTALGLNVTVISHEDMSSPAKVGPWCAGLDVIYTAETFYGVGFPAIAYAEGARTVCHYNPEFFKHWNEPTWPRPTEWWAPSPWMPRPDRQPVDVRFVPMPVPTDRWNPSAERVSGHVRFLFAGGKPAAGDRNGLRQLFMALRECTQPMVVTGRVQLNYMTAPGPLPRNVAYRAAPGNVKDYWRAYGDADVLVMPRRYGGLCLPAIEAAGAGLGLVMTDCDPNWYYPATLVEARLSDPVATPLGDIDSWECVPRFLAHVMDTIAGEPWRVTQMRERSRQWAIDNSWLALEGRWRAALEEAARS